MRYKDWINPILLEKWRKYWSDFSSWNSNQTNLLQGSSSIFLLHQGKAISLSNAIILRIFSKEMCATSFQRLSYQLYFQACVQMVSFKRNYNYPGFPRKHFDGLKDSYFTLLSIFNFLTLCHLSNQMQRYHEYTFPVKLNLWYDYNILWLWHTFVIHSSGKFVIPFGYTSILLIWLS